LTKKSVIVHSLDKENNKATFASSSTGEIYETKLTSCTCMHNRRTGATCKHMMALSEIFGVEIEIRKSEKSAKKPKVEKPTVAIHRLDKESQTAEFISKNSGETIITTLSSCTCKGKNFKKICKHMEVLKEELNITY